MAIYSEKVVHGDVRAANLLGDCEGKAWWVDLCTARLPSDSEEFLSEQRDLAETEQEG